jgi:hypothetical protein
MKKLRFALLLVVVALAATAMFVGGASAGRNYDNAGCSNVSYQPENTPANYGGARDQGQGIWNGSSEQYWCA